ncbi:MAG: hypothetical protein GC156_03250 [Actinomycetales bacterium]|nr:hypothetical protein [Actinomycetales bacterium]
MLPLIPNGVPVALGVRESLPLPVRGLPAERSADGVRVLPPEGLAGHCVVVLDDGVETGTAARAAASALREAGAAALVLAVPVCPREALADLQHRYDAVVAVVRPLARRALTWHYADFDTVDEAIARRLLADLPDAAG